MCNTDGTVICEWGNGPTLPYSYISVNMGSMEYAHASSSMAFYSANMAPRVWVGGVCNKPLETHQTLQTDKAGL